jgi:hypothetical protein
MFFYVFSIGKSESLFISPTKEKSKHSKTRTTFLFDFSSSSSHIVVSLLFQASKSNTAGKFPVYSSPNENRMLV